MVCQKEENNMTADDRIKWIEYLFDNDCAFERTLDTFIEYAKCKSVLMTLIAYLKSKNNEVSFVYSFKTYEFVFETVEDVQRLQRILKL
jgi:hypothetical protein